MIKKFFIALVSRVRLLFSECNKATDQWTKGIMAPISVQIREHGYMMDQRLENLKKIQKNLDNLHRRTEYLQAARANLEMQSQMTNDVLARINRSLPQAENLAMADTPTKRGAE